MSYRSLLLALWLGAGLVASACGPLFRHVEVPKTQTVSVNSTPPGATVTVADQGGSRVVGTTPTQIAASYSVVERRANEAACAAAGGAVVANALPSTRSAKSKGGKSALGALKLIGFFAGMGAGVAACKNAEGVVEVNPTRVQVAVYLPGYLPVNVDIEIPLEQPILHFELVPNLDRPSMSSQRPDPEQSTLVVFDLVAPGWDQVSGRLGVLSNHLADRLNRSREFSSVIQEDEATWMLKDEEGQRTDCAAIEVRCHRAICRARDSDFGLVTMLSRGDERCSVNATLFHVEENRPVRMSMVRSGCSDEQLLVALEDVAAELAGSQQLVSSATVRHSPAGR